MKRAIPIVATAGLVLALLTGCQAKPGTFVRADAQADVAGWTRSAEKAADSPTASTIANGYETCRTDTGYFTTSFQWRTITNLRIAASQQGAATAAISAAFAADGWAAKTSAGVVTLTGPKSATRRGVVRIETAGGSELAVSVISPCYH
jgi:hypothetical protein